jgi:hypothetical protein
VAGQVRGVSGLIQAAVDRPTTSFQVANRVSISRRYSWADSRCRRGRKGIVR